MNRSIHTLLCIALAVANVAASDQPRTHELRLRLARDQTLGLRVATEQKNVTEVDGDKQEVRQNLAFDYTIKVLEVDSAGTATVRMTYESVRFRQDGPMGLIEYDSASPSDDIPQLALGYSGLPGQSVQFKIRPDGRIAELTGAEELVEAMLMKLQMPEGVEKSMLMQAIRNQFRAEPLRRSLEMITAVFPDKAVEVGANWTRAGKLTLGFEIQADHTWTLTSVDKQQARIGVLSVLRTDPAVPFFSGPMRMFWDLKGTQTGEVVVDLATGWFVSGSLHQVLKGVMYQGSPQGRAVSASIDIQISISPLTRPEPSPAARPE